MDGIQPYAAAGAPRPAPAPAHGLTAHVQTAAHPHHPGGASAKSPSDYIRALKRRIWLVMAVGVPLAVAGAAWVVRMPNVYRASAQILIEPPQFDPVLSTLLSTSVGHHDAEA